MHGLGPPGQHGEQLGGLGLVQAVGVGEQAHPVGGAAALVARVGAERHEAVQGVGDISQPRPGGGGIPVDERPVTRADDQVPWGQVVVGDHAGPLGGDAGLASGHPAAGRSW